jgi:hypothetical protein
MRARFVSIIAFMVFSCSQDVAKAVNPPQKADEHRMRVLVELLASKNKPPERYPFPATYDKNAQVIVYCPLLGGLKPSPLGEGFSRQCVVS